MSGRFLSRRGFLAGMGGIASAQVLFPCIVDAADDVLIIDLHVTRGHLTIDGVKGTAYFVNGMFPAPLLRWKEGKDVIIRVHNHMDEATAIHWHGVRVPSSQDGVPGLSFMGIPPGEIFTYRFPVQQSGTYWYHSHVGGQEAFGLYGALIIEPREKEHLPSADREHVILLSDWSDVSPDDIISNLKMQDDYYTFRQRTVSSLATESRQIGGVIPALQNRLQWSHMRMAATDISDVSGVIYKYLLNGVSSQTGWEGVFHGGETVRLHVINGAAMTLFDVRIPGLEMLVVEADGNAVEPVPIDEFRIAPGETYVVHVSPIKNEPYTVFAQSEDRTGFARGTLTPHLGWKGNVPKMDPRPVRGMRDMGMAMQENDPKMASMMMSNISSFDKDPADEIDDPGTPPLNVENQNVAQHPFDRTSSPGDGLENNGRRVLAYSHLKSLYLAKDQRPPSREIILHLTGNMERYIWGFNGRKYSESGPIQLKKDERIRFTIINDTMMEHPLHLHGLWSELENGNGDYRPVKHTIISQPGSRLSFLVTADAVGRWAYHCHLMDHMATGMFREVIVQ